MAPSTAADRVSTATTLYLDCTAALIGDSLVTFERTVDGSRLAGSSFTVVPRTPLVASAVAEVPKYSQPMRITVTGEDLDLGLTATSSACKTLTLSTAVPYVSGAAEAYFLCDVQSVGDQTITLKRTSDGSTLGTVAFTVPLPQVTMAVSNGASVNGSLVFTLQPDKAPVTVNNFLGYVHSGFYDNTVFHRAQAGFVVQGGGYASPVVAGTVPTHKTTLDPIALEVGVGLSNTQWSVAMARTSVLASATSEFFINLGNNSSLDTSGGGYAVFATVTSGTDVVSSIVSAPCTTIAGFVSTALGCVPIPNVVISSAVQTR